MTNQTHDDPIEFLIELGHRYPIPIPAQAKAFGTAVEQTCGGDWIDLLKRSRAELERLREIERKSR